MSSSEIALALLMDRLSWPVKMVRWKAARAIRELLVKSATRDNTTRTLLKWMSNCDFESEIGSALSVLLVTPAEARPEFDSVCRKILKPSILSGLLLEKIYDGRCSDNWVQAHSGPTPKGFVVSDYFEKHKRSHVPIIFASAFERLELEHNLPFTNQWAYEWQRIAERSQVQMTGYPYYFGDLGRRRSGAVGQFIQRQGEVFRSAYFRTLAFAVSQWGMPAVEAASHVFHALSALPDLFDVEPQGRPEWLGDIPTKCLADDADLEEIGRQIVAAGTTNEDCLISLGTPLPAKVAELHDLSLSAFFVTDDFITAENQILRPIEIPFFSDEFRFNGVREDLKISAVAGKSGSAVSICSQAWPILHGFWHDDYFQRGLLLPAPYCFDAVTVQQADIEGLRLLIGPDTVASTSFWHDAWTPLNSLNGPTRCGVIATMKRKCLESMALKLKMRIGWQVHMSFPKKESDDNSAAPRSRSAFFV